MRRKVFSAELLIGLAAIIVSITTLIVFIYQTNLIRKQQYMSVYPHLSIVHKNSYSTNYKFTLRNQGIGPAFIKSIEIKDKEGKSYDDLHGYLDSNLKLDSVSLSYTDIYEGALIQEKQEIVLYKLADSPFYENTAAKADRLREVMGSQYLKMKIDYESIYGERWTFDNNATMPIKH